ncbi:hypothetical protein [Streptomyces sp. NPDC101455]|uniref:hypothetical protein n=1 Tax=Streptomyces sp. NPDC101455 TaxID=3366142 RepID=UPI00382DC05A
MTANSSARASGISRRRCSSSTSGTDGWVARPAGDRFYEDVFGGLHFLGVDEANYLPIEDRYAGLFMVGDVCIETMAPALPADGTKPVGKFYN